MTTASMTLHQPKQVHSEIADALQITLADTYGLYLVTHNYHWNVEGPRFFMLHQAFSDQYNELFGAIDKIAERIRALGFYALPFEGDSILASIKMVSNSLNKEVDANERADRMIRNLVNLNEGLVKSCQFVKQSAQDMRDSETENMMVERITVHQKVLWMLNSVLR